MLRRAALVVLGVVRLSCTRGLSRVIVKVVVGYSSFMFTVYKN